MLPSFTLWGRTISMYGLLALVGALTAGFYAMRTAKKHGYGDQGMLTTLLFAAIGIAVGGSLLHAAVNAQAVLSYVRGSGGIAAAGGLLRVAALLLGGSVFYGGLIGGFIAGYIYIRVKKLPAAAYTDIAAPAIPLFHFFGRIGCFLGGCCYGIPWPGGVVFHSSPAPLVNGIPRFPVQLVEAVLNLALFLLLAWLLRKNLLRGRLMALYLLTYAAIRFSLEFLRGDSYRGFALGLSTSQWVSMGLAVSTLVWLLYAKRKNLFPQKA